jgi:hypothetical protein
MPYIAPHLRKEPTKDEANAEAIKVISEGSDHHFPQLGRNGVTERSDTSMQWENIRTQSEIRSRVDARMAEHFERKRQEEEITYATLRRVAPQPKPVIRRQEEELEPVPEVPAEDEWIEVKKKARKPKKKKSSDSENEDIDIQNFIDNDESSWT